MNSYVLDTNHVSALLKKNDLLSRKVQSSISKVGLSIVMPCVAELWFMVFNSDKLKKNTEELEQISNGLSRWDFIGSAAMEFGRIKAELRRTGRPIPDPDIQIAAIARLNDLTVLTADAHFNNVLDLKSENWLI